MRAKMEVMFATTRLQMEVLDHRHAGALVVALNHEAVGEFIGGPDVTTVAALHHRIDGLREGPPPGSADQQWLNFVVRRTGDGVVLGRVEATVYGEWAEIAYLFDPGVWGHGYATEAVQWLIDYLATALDVTEVWAAILHTNARSIRLAQRVGLVEQPNPTRVPASFDPGDVVFGMVRP